jgi:uncharacterized SAM-dependent methyltransferase
MHLRAKRAHTVSVGGRTFQLAAGETIRTEESYKYSPEHFARISEAAGLSVEALWLDERELFSIQWLVPDGG